MKIAHVSDMQKIEAAVGKRNLLSILPPGIRTALQLFASKNFRVLQWDLVWGGVSSIASASSCCETVAVPRFITTIPPA